MGAMTWCNIHKLLTHTYAHWLLLSNKILCWLTMWNKRLINSLPIVKTINMTLMPELTLWHFLFIHGDTCSIHCNECALIIILSHNYRPCVIKSSVAPFFRMFSSYMTDLKAATDKNLFQISDSTLLQILLHQYTCVQFLVKIK